MQEIEKSFQSSLSFFKIDARKAEICCFKVITHIQSGAFFFNLDNKGLDCLAPEILNFPFQFQFEYGTAAAAATDFFSTNQQQPQQKQHQNQQHHKMQHH